MDPISLSAGPLFLTGPELVQLTGWKLKTRQIEWLRKNAIPFWSNATGHPVVTRTTIEGNSHPQLSGKPERQKWTPKVLGA